MSRRLARFAKPALWTLAALGFAVGGGRWAASDAEMQRRVDAAQEEQRRGGRAEGELDPISIFGTRDVLALARATTVIVERDVFQIGRRPSPVSFSLQPTEEASSDPKRSGLHTEPHDRPTLGLGGIVGGPPWEAILEGVPGHENALVVRQGDTIDQLHVLRIGRDTVIVTGLDTTWILTLKRPWRQ